MQKFREHNQWQFISADLFAASFRHWFESRHWNGDILRKLWCEEELHILYIQLIPFRAIKSKTCNTREEYKHLAQDWVHWQAFVKTVTARNFLFTSVTQLSEEDTTASNQTYFVIMQLNWWIRKQDNHIKYDFKQKLMMKYPWKKYGSMKGQKWNLRVTRS